MKESCTVRMIGMPPATAASKWIGVSFSLDKANNSMPRSASRALLPVTTGFFARSAAATISNASVVPPISSTTMSTAGSSTSLRQSVVNISAGTSPVVARAFAVLRTRILAMCKRTPPPVRPVINSPLRSSTFHTPEPTVPNPAKPMPSDEQDFTPPSMTMNQPPSKPELARWEYK